MFVKIVNPKYIKTDSALLDFLRDDFTCEKYKLALIKSIENKSKVVEDELFEVVDYVEPEYGFYSYLIISNRKGTFLVREDNVESTGRPEDVMEELGLRKLIRGGKKTILIDEDGEKFTTTLDDEDKDDPEKAVMILLLKRMGYSIKDIYTITELIK